MKSVNKVVTALAAIVAVGMLASCGSTSGASDAGKAPAQEAAPEKPEKATEPPQYTFEGTELKIEIENMYYDEFLIFADEKASGGWAGKLLGEESFAEALVTFPAGEYEGLVNEDAPDGSSDAFYVFVDGAPYRSYPSDPPIGTYELTERTPMKIIFEEEKTVTVRIQKDDPNGKTGEAGMKLDYIIFTRKGDAPAPAAEAEAPAAEAEAPAPEAEEAPAEAAPEAEAGEAEVAPEAEAAPAAE